jgi:hypothetical protein
VAERLGQSVCFRFWNLSVLALWAASRRRPPEFITRAAALGKIRHARRAVLCWLPEFGCWLQEFILIGCMGVERVRGDGLLHRIASNLFGLCLIPGYALCEGTMVHPNPAAAQVDFPRPYVVIVTG